MRAVPWDFGDKIHWTAHGWNRIENLELEPEHVPDALIPNEICAGCGGIGPEYACGSCGALLHGDCLRECELCDANDLCPGCIRDHRLVLR